MHQKGIHPDDSALLCQDELNRLRIHRFLFLCARSSGMGRLRDPAILSASTTEPGTPRTEKEHLRGQGITKLFACDVSYE
jgi:hypothetical protein